MSLWKYLFKPLFQIHLLLLQPKMYCSVQIHALKCKCFIKNVIKTWLLPTTNITTTTTITYYMYGFNPSLLLSETRETWEKTLFKVTPAWNWTACFCGVVKQTPRLLIWDRMKPRLLANNVFNTFFICWFFFYILEKTIPCISLVGKRMGLQSRLEVYSGIYLHFTRQKACQIIILNTV